jgi:regulator of sigma E protease
LSAVPGFILILLGFGFLIFIHELGHFLAAKWARIRADGFAIGMGPCLASYRRGVGLVLGSADAAVFRKHGRRPIEMRDADMAALGLGETEYSLRMLPIGGYVRMLGQEDGNPAAVSEDARSFTKAPIFRRAVVILAGIVANLVLAIVLFLIAFLVGVRFPAATIGAIGANSPAARATSLDAGVPNGLRAGDRVVAIDGDETQTFLDLRLAAAMAKPETALEVSVARGDATHRFSVTPERDRSVGLLAIGVDPARSATITDVRASRTEVAKAIEESDAGLAKAGVGPGSTALRVVGASIGSFADLERAASDYDGKPMTVVWQRPATPAQETGSPSTEFETTVTPRPLFDALVTPAAEGRDELEEFGIVSLAPLPVVRAIDKASRNHDELKPGDVFLRIGTVQGPRESQLRRTLNASPNATIPALVLRDGKEVAVSVRTDAEGRAGVFLGFALELPRLANSIAEVVSRPSTDADKPAATRATPVAALKTVPLGWIETVEERPIADFFALRAALVAAAKSHEGNEPLTINLSMRDPSPDAAPTSAQMVLGAEDLAALRSLGYAFPLSAAIFDPNFTVLSANGNPLKAIAMGFRQTLLMVEQVFLTLDRVGRGSVGVEQLQGPVGILHTGTQVADEGLMYVLFFLALISVNLAVVNALPIPIADGGLFMFLMYEKIRGKPPSIGFQNAAALAGITLVAGIFLLTFYNDLMRLFA